MLATVLAMCRFLYAMHDSSDDIASAGIWSYMLVKSNDVKCVELARICWMEDRDWNWVAVGRAHLFVNFEFTIKRVADFL